MMDRTRAEPSRGQEARSDVFTTEPETVTTVRFTMSISTSTTKGQARSPTCFSEPQDLLQEATLQNSLFCDIYRKTTLNKICYPGPEQTQSLTPIVSVASWSKEALLVLSVLTKLKVPHPPKSTFQGGRLERFSSW